MEGRREGKGRALILGISEPQADRTRLCVRTSVKRSPGACVVKRCGIHLITHTS